MTCRPMRPTEAAEVADLHRAVFPDYESSRLGPAFCRRLLDAYSVRTDAFVLVTGGDGGPITGYLVGCPPAVQRAVNDQLAVRGALAYAANAVRSPRRMASGLGTAWKRARRVAGQKLRRGAPSASPADGVAGPAVESDVRVVLIGVAPVARGTGAADALLDGFAARARRWGAARADLVLEAGNEPARRCYERNGWRVQPTEASGRSSRYWLELTDGTGPEPHPAEGASDDGVGPTAPG